MPYTVLLNGDIVCDTAEEALELQRFMHKKEVKNDETIQAQGGEGAASAQDENDGTLP